MLDEANGVEQWRGHLYIGRDRKMGTKWKELKVLGKIRGYGSLRSQKLLHDFSQDSKEYQLHFAARETKGIKTCQMN